MLKPAVSGFLMQRELRYLGEALHQPKRPFVAVLGGAKISGKIDLISALLPKVDHVLLGGAMACTFFAAMGLETGNSLVEPDRIELARRAHGRRRATSWCCRAARVVARELKADAETRTVPRDAIPDGWAVYDIDPATEKDFAARIAGGGHGGVERPDGRLRDAAVRPRHHGDRARHGRRRPARARSRWSAAAIRPPRWHRRDWRTG